MATAKALLTHPPRWLEPVTLLVLGCTLLLRYPVNFLLYPPFLMDFEVYRATAERLLQGAGARLYDPTTSEMMIFKYAPMWALLWSPLGWASTYVGGILWTTASVLALLATLVLCARLCRRFGIHHHPFTAVLAVLILVRPLAEEMGNGQSNLLWGFLTVSAVYARTVRRPWLSATSLAAAILLKLPTLLFLPYLILSRDWRQCGRLLTAGCVLLVLPSLLILPKTPLTLLIAWARALATNGGAYAFIIGNQSLLALLARFLTADGYGLNVLRLSHPAIFLLSLGLAALLLVGLALPKDAPEQPDRWLYDSAILMVCMVIFSPTCWSATYTALLFPLFLGAATLTHQLIAHRGDALACGLAGVMLAAALLTNHAVWLWLRIASWHGEAYLYMVFMVLTWLSLALIGLLWRQRRFLRAARPPRAA